MGGGLKQSRGTFVWSSSGSKYEREWVDDLRHGQGVLPNTNGRKYEGGWEKNKKHGKGIVTNEVGSSYVGHYMNGKKIFQQRQESAKQDENIVGSSSETKKKIDAFSMRYWGREKQGHELRLEPATNGFYIKHAPKETITGVGKNMIRFCTSIAGQIYSSSKAKYFKLSIGNIIKAEVVQL